MRIVISGPANAFDRATGKAVMDAQRLEHGADPAIRAANGENALENWSKNTHLKNHQEIAALLSQSF